MSGFQTMQCTQQNGAWDKQPKIGATLLDEVGKGGHGISLKVFGDLLELIERSVAIFTLRACRIIEAMVDMVVDKGFLGGVNRAGHGVKLLRHFKAWIV